MKLVTYRSNQGLQSGVVTARGVLAVSQEGKQDWIGEWIRGGSVGVDSLHSYVADKLNDPDEDSFIEEDQLDFAPCIPSPGKIICVGLNYRKHALESVMPIPETPILFSKFANTLSGHQDPILLPKESRQNDYEAELGIVISKKAKNVSEENALHYVFGYCNANDLSSRDWQFRTNQWLLGKSIDGFCPVGPYLVTSDEIRDPNGLNIVCKVNGEVRQRSHTSDMIFHCREIISYISKHMTLEPGDLVLTGTPEGVVLGYPKDQQVWLEDGDVVTIEIDGLGALTNTMKRER